MRPRSSFTFSRTLLLLQAMALLCGVSMAQNDRGSLTEQFPNMSAKERSRIAAKEVEEAQKDGAYQSSMLQAEQSFKEGRYEEALELYEQARAMRPYNVYPKVKIEDLRALLAKQAAPPDSVPALVEVHPVDVEAAPIPPPVKEVTPPVRREPVLPVSTDAPPPAKAERVTVKPPAPEPSTLKPADGVIERRYREGHAFVLERVVTVDGRVVKYKRVFHSWGQVFYFEDGLAVDERVWKARFPDR